MDAPIEITSEEIKRLKVAKVMCLRSLMFHTRYFFKLQQKRQFIQHEHLKIIVAALERVLTGKCTRLIISLAPRYGKTELVIKGFISHALSLNPAAKFIHLSYSDDLALDNSERVKDIITSAEYQQLFPEVQIKKGSTAKDKWYTTQGGGVLARSAGGQVTGFGAGQVDLSPEEQKKLDEQFGKELDEFLTSKGISLPQKTNLDLKFEFGGAILIDDPIKPEDADSDVKLNRVNNQFDSTIRTRANSRKTPIVLIMQRVHPLDLSGYLQRSDESDKWEVISLPCINEQDNPYGLPAGEALCEFKHTLEELEALKKANEIVFERQMMQNPKPKAGLLFPIQDLKFFNPDEIALDDPDFCYVPADPANLGGDDFAAGPFKLIGDEIFLTDVLYNTDGSDENEKRLVQLVFNNKASEASVEGVLGWKETADRVRDELVEKGYENEFRILRPRTKKHTRILNRASFIRNHIRFRSDWEKYPQYAKFMRCLTSYLRIQAPGAENKRDDAPDLCEMAATYYERNFKHLWGYERTKSDSNS